MASIPSEVPMDHAPENRVFYRLEHVSPGGVEDAGHLVPGQTLRPAGQEPAVAGRQVTFSLWPKALAPPSPRSFGQSTRRMAYTKNTAIPHKRHELEPPLRQPIVARPRPTAARADRPAILAGMHLHFERRSPGVFHPSGFSVHKGLERFDPIEDSLQLHPVVAPGEMAGFANPSLTGNPAGCTCFPSSSFRLYCSCLAKRSRALLGSNPTRDNQARAGE